MPLTPVQENNANGITFEAWNLQRLGNAVGNLQADVSRIEDVLAEMRTINKTIASSLDRNYDIVVKLNTTLDQLEDKHQALHTKFESHLASVTARGAVAGGGLASAIVLIAQHLITLIGN